MLFNEIIVPKANYDYTVLKSNLQKTQKNIQNNINLTEYDEGGEPSRILNIQVVDGYDLKGITVAEFADGFLNRIILAKDGRWQVEGDGF